MSVRREYGEGTVRGAEAGEAGEEAPARPRDLECRVRERGRLRLFPSAGAGAWAEDMAAAGRRERRRGAKRRVEATNGDGVGAATTIGFISSVALLSVQSALGRVWESFSESRL